MENLRVSSLFADNPAPSFGAGGPNASRAFPELLRVEGLTCGYGRKEIVRNVSFRVDEGEFLCVIGANGCGKTTLLKTVLGLLPSLGGCVFLRGHDVLGMTERQRARLLAYIPQAHTPPFPFSVADVVLMGRTPHIGRMSKVDFEDRRIAWRALRLLGIEQLARQTYTHLSGGQQQLVLIARALAQQPELVIMDEPCASLDFGNQQMVLSRMKTLAAAGTSVVMVTHDPYHAFYCASRVMVMQEGAIVADGPPREVMTRELLESIYHAQVNIVEVTLTTGKTTPVCVPL